MSQAAHKLESEPRNGEVRIRKPFAGGKVDPSVAGKLGAQAKERNALLNIGKARTSLGNAAPKVARELIAAATGTNVSPVQLGAMNSVLDRTVGKAPQEIRVGMADQTMQVLDMLELED